MATRKASIKETGEEISQADWERFDAAVARARAERDQAGASQGELELVDGRYAGAAKASYEASRRAVATRAPSTSAAPQRPSWR